MTPEERARYFGHWWPDACQAKGWRVKDEVRRRHTTGECLRLVRGPRTESTTDLGRDEVTALKTYLLHLANPSDLKLAANWVDCMQDYKAYNRARQADWHERQTYGAKGSKKLRRDRFAGQQSASGETFERFDPEAIRKRHMTMARRHKAHGYRPKNQPAGDLRFVAEIAGRVVVGAPVNPARPAEEQADGNPFSTMQTKLSDQAELRFDAADPSAVATPADVEKLAMILSDGGLLTAAEICVKLGRLPTENNKRRIRAAARASFPQILGFSLAKEENQPRLEGYKLLRQCTIEEAWKAANAMSHLKRDITIREKLLLDEIHSGRVGRSTP